MNTNNRILIIFLTGMLNPLLNQGRLEILKVHSRNKVLSDDVDLENIATACTQMTGAMLATLVNTAALRAVLEGRDEISQVGSRENHVTCLL